MIPQKDHKTESFMTLEDFFTISELKNGLSVPSRVPELLKLMQENTDSAPKNRSETARQWSAVAATISATDNHHCLDLFLQSGGHLFFNRWLRDAQIPLENPASASITAILKALEKLQMGYERSRSSGIRSTVHTLLQHSSPPVRDLAAALLQTWAPPLDSSVSESGKLSPAPKDVYSSTDSNMPAPDRELEKSRRSGSETSGDRSEDSESVSGESEDGRLSKPRALTAIEQEYGLVDALEVARKVANEVEQELVDEAFCSTSPSAEPGGVDSPDKTVSVLDIEPSLVTDPSPGVHPFDLNQCLWSDREEEDQFGWKGSAVTSAFLPTSPQSSRRPLPGIDLNVAEVESSEEVSGNTSVRPDIDLNRAADNDSESMSSVRDIDLNGPYRPCESTPPCEVRTKLFERVGPTLLCHPCYPNYPNYGLDRIAAGSVGQFQNGSTCYNGLMGGGSVGQLQNGSRWIDGWVGGKRKEGEMEGGWEAYSYRKKHVQKSWL